MKSNKLIGIVATQRSIRKNRNNLTGVLIKALLGQGLVAFLCDSREHTRELTESAWQLSFLTAKNGLPIDYRTIGSYNRAVRARRFG